MALVIVPVTDIIAPKEVTHVKRMLEHLHDLVGLTAPSGFEEDAVQYISRELNSLRIDHRVDALGNVIATKPGTGAPRLVISAHADEIGFMVSKIEPNGFIRFETLGGIDPRILLAQRVWLRGGKGRLMGVVGCKSAHLSGREGRDRVVPLRDLYIDVGADDRDTVVAAGIDVGTPISFVSELTALGCGDGKRLVGKGFDDRLGCVMLLRLFRELKDIDHTCTIVGIFSSQEELGLRGAQAASFGVEADVALAIDATACGDAPDCHGEALSLGNGAGIKVLDNRIVAHTTVRNRLVDVARQNNIRYQLEILKGIGTDAGALHLSGGGLPTGVISIPNRYTHSPIELVDVDDLENAYRLLKAFTLSLRPGDNFAFGGGRFGR